MKLESTKTLDIERFVSESEIDRAYWDQPYFLAPDGKVGQEAYAVIREAMRQSGQIALGRVVLSTRERLMALEPHGQGIMAFSLRTKGEVRSSAEAFGQVEDVKADPAMISIAETIIKQQAGPFDPTQFNDRYEDALKALIAQKTAGRVAVGAVPEPQDTNVIDLMAALRASLTRGGAPSPGGKAASKAAVAQAASAKQAPAQPKPTAAAAAKGRRKSGCAGRRFAAREAGLHRPAQRARRRRPPALKG